MIMLSISQVKNHRKEGSILIDGIISAMPKVLYVAFLHEEKFHRHIISSVTAYKLIQTCVQINIKENITFHLRCIIYKKESQKIVLWTC